MAFEAKIIIFLQNNISVGWITFFMTITAFASVIGLLFFAGVIFYKDKKMSLFFAVYYGMTALVNLAVKQIFERPRPFDAWPQIANLGNEDGYSMPSSHCAIAAMTAVFMCYFAFTVTKSRLIRGLTIVAMTLFACLIALSRMVLGVHYLTDTLAGFAEGALMAYLGIQSYKKINLKRKTAE